MTRIARYTCRVGHGEQPQDYRIQMEVTMSTVLYVGMDVHSTSYSLATFALGDREGRASS